MATDSVPTSMPVTAPKLQLYNNPSAKEVRAIQDFLKIHHNDTAINIHRIKSNSNFKERTNTIIFVQGMNDGTIYKFTMERCNWNPIRKILKSQKNPIIAKGKIYISGKEIANQTVNQTVAASNCNNSNGNTKAKAKVESDADSSENHAKSTSKFKKFDKSRYLDDEEGRKYKYGNGYYPYYGLGLFYPWGLGFGYGLGFGACWCFKWLSFC